MTITGKRMKERRKELGLRAEQVAEYIGVSRATLFRYENGDIEKVPFNSLAPLARVLCTNVGWLAGWNDNADTIEMLPDSMITPEARFAYEHRNPKLQRLINAISDIPEDKLGSMITIVESIKEMCK